MKHILTTIFFFITIGSWATTWGPVYPYIQKTEDGKVKSHSVPYGVHDGPHGLGQTFVYANGKLLYTIDKYFSTHFFTTNEGELLVEFDFDLYYRQPIQLVDKDGNVTLLPSVYDGEVVNIYKKGKLFKSITFAELKIDTSTINRNEYARWFAWNYMAGDSIKNQLSLKMEKNPAFIDSGNLCLITSDNQLITIEISTGKIVNRQNAYETLKQKSNWTPTELKRKYQKIKYPDKSLLPKLINGKSMEQALAEHLNKKVSDDYRDSVLIHIYFHTLLINIDGKPEDIYVSPSIPSKLKKDFYGGNDQLLKTEIEKWVMEQTFDTSSIPRKFLKFKYEGFVYLKE